MNLAVVERRRLLVVIAVPKSDTLCLSIRERGRNLVSCPAPKLNAQLRRSTLAAVDILLSCSRSWSTSREREGSGGFNFALDSHSLLRPATIILERPSEAVGRLLLRARAPASASRSPHSHPVRGRKVTRILLTPVDLLGLEHDETKALQRRLLPLIADLQLLHFLLVIITDRLSWRLVDESSPKVTRESLPLLEAESLPVEIRKERGDGLLRGGRGGRVEMDETSDSDLIARG